MKVTATVTPAQVKPGGTATVTFQVTNGNDSAADGLVLVNQFSSGGAEARSASVEGGSCTVSSREVSCRLGSLPPGGSATATVQLWLRPEADTGVLMQQASLSGGSLGGPLRMTVSNLVSADGSDARRQVLDFPGETVTMISLTLMAVSAAVSPNRVITTRTD